MITRTISGNNIELRSFALTDMVKYGWTDSLSVNTMGERELRGIPAISRAAQLRAQAIANLRLYCWSGDRDMPTRRDNVPQARLFAKAQYNEYQTRFSFWETVGESLAYRNFAAIWKNVDPLSGQVLEVMALHPDQVVCKDDRYVVTVQSGYVDPTGRGPARYEVDDSTLLWIRGYGNGGTISPSPILDTYRTALAGPVGRQRHEARMWRRGTALQVGVEFPAGVTPDQANEWRESWRSSYEGTDGETTAVIGGGATIKPIGMTAADAQFVDMAKLTVEDASRIMGVPANLLGSQLERAVPNLEQDLQLWLRTGLSPELARIEAALEGDFELFGNAQTYPMFNTEGFVRGDLMSEATILQGEVQAGILTPNEARAKMGMEPLPGSVGNIPQITPVGGAPNKVPAMNGNGNGNSPDN